MAPQTKTSTPDLRMVRMAEELHYIACANGQAERVKQLLDNNADVEAGGRPGGWHSYGCLLLR